MRQNIVLRVIAKAMIPFIMLFALYVQFHGDFGPGGGFQAGVIFAAAFVLYTLIFGLDEAKRVVPERVLHLLVPFGVLLYAGTGVWCLYKGGKFLEYNVLSTGGAHGQHLGIFLVELGVGITVTAVITSIFYAFVERGRA